MVDGISTAEAASSAAIDPDRRRMLGPFFRPLSRDWLFGLWVGLVVATTWAYATQPVAGETSATFTLARWLIGAAASALGYLALLGVTVGLWRGYHLGRADTDA